MRESSVDRVPRAGPHLARRLVGHAVRLSRVRRRRRAQGRLEARRRGNAGLRENGGCRRRRAGRSCSGHRRANRDQERRICACCGPRPCFRQALDEHWRNSSHTRPRGVDVQKRRPRGLDTTHCYTVSSAARWPRRAARRPRRAGRAASKTRSRRLPGCLPLRHVSSRRRRPSAQRGRTRSRRGPR